MKAIIITMALFLVSGLNAQVTVGLKSGYTRAWQNYGDVVLPDDAETHVHAYNVSGLLYVPLYTHFKIGIEPGYIQRGAACVPGWNQISPVFEGDTKFFLNYVELPVMVAVNYPFLNNRLSVFGKAGYGISGISTAIREDFPNVTDDIPTRTRIEMGKNSILNRFDHGMYSGIGLGYNFGTNHQFFIESNYYYGLRDAERFNASKNRGVNIDIGYSFSL